MESDPDYWIRGDWDLTVPPMILPTCMPEIGGVGPTRKRAFHEAFGDGEYEEWVSEVEEFVSDPKRPSTGVTVVSVDGKKEIPHDPLPRKSIVFRSMPRESPEWSRWGSAVSLAQTYFSTKPSANEVHDVFILRFHAAMTSIVAELVVFSGNNTTMDNLLRTRTTVMSKIWHTWCGDIAGNAVRDPLANTFYDAYPFAVRNTAKKCSKANFTRDMELMKRSITEKHLDQRVNLVELLDTRDASDIDLMFDMILRPSSRRGEVVSGTAGTIVYYFVFVLFASVLHLSDSIGFPARFAGASFNTNPREALFDYKARIGLKMLRFFYYTVKTIVPSVIRKQKEASANEDKNALLGTYTTSMRSFVMSLGPLLSTCADDQ